MQFEKGNYSRGAAGLSLFSNVMEGAVDYWDKAETMRIML